ncbi:ATP-binding protein [Veillonella parvula]|uniref:ATP-binding protein n=1 Tax=Veillonella parvula TaxID=29466 RepID=UPI00265E02EA|nr:ATP-binding protein [Veillonella parvula]
MISYVVGNVISIDGTKISILMNDQSNLEMFHHNGEYYNGVSVGSYIGIIRGSHKIIGRVEKEYSQDKSNNPNNMKYLVDRFERILEISIVGTIYNGHFELGQRLFPMIFNEVVLLTQSEVLNILTGNNHLDCEKTIFIGKTVAEGIPISLQWNKLFNTHIGIFGNTGSGKSNTLAKLFSSIFDLHIAQKIDLNKSQFFILDFNGEYINDLIFSNQKKTIKLSTQNRHVNDRIPISEEKFWDIETLSILYAATEKTQKPFLNNTIRNFVDENHKFTKDKIITGIELAFENVFYYNNHKESLILLLKCLEVLEISSDKISEKATSENPKFWLWLKSSWHSQANTFYTNDGYFNDDSIRAQIETQKNKFSEFISSLISENLLVTKKLKIAVYCQMIYGLSFGRIQYEHISPLMHRIESNSSWVDKLICITTDNSVWSTINVISLKDCNVDAKKVIPLLLCKGLYDSHKELSRQNETIEETIHLIIDEAHNILSESSNRESESWKDYRLETFEEIIKEGRKFGVYLTIASQRPADISSTIISQLHNNFIHRLVNEQDLRMIASSVSSLDSVSRSQLPTLAAGQCIISGTSFDMPLLIQIEPLEKDRAPKSESADLDNLWQFTPSTE